MRNSPFSIFRRHERKLMVVLTGLAMFSFLFMDMASPRSGQGSTIMAALIIGMLVSAGCWVIGSPRGRGGEYAAYGAVVGVLVAFIAFRSSGPPVVARTNIGNFTQADLQHMAQQRGQANRFAMRAGAQTPAMFGSTDERALVRRALFLHEAKRLGISLSDEAVNDYIKRITGERLSVKDFQKILQEMGISEAQLFDAIREELEGFLALQMSRPPSTKFGSGTVQTPLQYWKEFQQLEVRQVVEAAAIPVSQFLSQIPEPKDSELTDLFNQTKDRLPTPDGKPGFLRDRQVQLAYLVAEYEAFEKTVTEPTDDEIAEHYEKNKDRLYRAPPEIPDLPTQPAGADAEPPVSALEPANTAAPGANVPPPPSKPEDGGQAAADDDDAESLAAACAPDAAEKKDETADQPNAPAAKAEPDAAAEKPSPPAEASQPAVPKAKTTGFDPSALPQFPALPPSPGAKPGEEFPVKYLELDDALKGRIRDSLLRERTFAAMDAARNDALEEMSKAADLVILAAPDDSEKAQKAAEVAARLKAFADKKKLRYVETKPMTREALSSSADEPIGMALEPGSGHPLFGGGQPIAVEIFSNESLYLPRPADSLQGDQRYAYWKIADHPAKVPEFKDVKQEVIDAWKQLKARPLAEKRAQQLAEAARQSDKPLAEALAGQTITGAAEAPAVTVRETPRFSWKSVPQVPPMGLRPDLQSFQPQNSLVPGVHQPGDEFMRIVFEELSPGKVGVAPNQPLTEYYVVKVKERDAAGTADDLALRALQQQFLREGQTDFRNPMLYYHFMASAPLEEIERRWLESFESRFEITWMKTETALAERE